MPSDAIGTIDKIATWPHSKARLPTAALSVFGSNQPTSKTNASDGRGEGGDDGGWDAV